MAKNDILLGTYLTLAAIATLLAIFGPTRFPPIRRVLAVIVAWIPFVGSLVVIAESLSGKDGFETTIRRAPESLADTIALHKRNIFLPVFFAALALFDCAMRGSYSMWLLVSAAFVLLPLIARFSYQAKRTSFVRLYIWFGLNAALVLPAIVVTILIGVSARVPAGALQSTILLGTGLAVPLGILYWLFYHRRFVSKLTRLRGAAAGGFVTHSEVFDFLMSPRDRATFEKHQWLIGAATILPFSLAAYVGRENVGLALGGSGLALALALLVAVALHWLDYIRIIGLRDIMMREAPSIT